MPVTLGDSINPVALANYDDVAEAGYVGGRWPTYATLVRTWAAKAAAGLLVSIAIAASEDALCLDVELGDATIGQAPAWVRRQHARGVARPWVYVSLASAQALVDALAAAGIARTEYVLWVAHYSYRAHICGPGCGYGLATSADATQWTDAVYGTDQSLVADGVLPLVAAPVVPPAPPSPPAAAQPSYAGMASTRTGAGYWLAKSDGSIITAGDAGYAGGPNTSGGKPVTLAAPIVGVAADPAADGYWCAAADGGVFSFGAAPFCGSAGGAKLTAPVVGMAADGPTGGGYRLTAADGGVFCYGDATFHGSLGGIKLTQPIVGIVATATDAGYWLVAADGGIFAFGDASFAGSLGGVPLAKPVVGIAATPGGYLCAAADGGVFCFGAAGFYGSLGGVRLDRPIVDIVATPTGHGYWLVGADGGVFSFGDAHYEGSGAGK